jgi:two-component system phosphate regulon sensor histidine kinase PhoR
MNRSLFGKIFIGYLLIIFALASLILILSLNTVRDFHRDLLANHLKNLAFSLNPEVLHFWNTGRASELEEFIKNLGTKIQTRITIVSGDGRVIADSEEDRQTMGDHSYRPEIFEALQGKTGKSIRFSSTANKEALYVAVPMENAGNIPGVIRTSLFLEDIDRLLTNLYYQVAQITLVVVLLALLGAFLVSNSVVRPIKNLISAARQVAAGDFSVRVFSKNRDELRELAGSFNRMNEEMQKMFSEIAQQKEELNLIIHSLQEGLLVLDGQGRITRANESSLKIFGNRNLEGKQYWEAIRSPQMVELLRKAGSERRNVSEEFPLGERVFLCGVAPLEKREDLVVVFQDITEIKKTEKVKRDFVTNVSHELHTPLTAIKGYAETLLDEVSGETGKRYLEIIQGNTDRLINIVQDLLLLSTLEEGRALDLEDIDLKNFIGDIVRLFEPRLKDKQLFMEVDVKESLPTIKADLLKLEQVLVNLLDNAVKYTERGKIVVSADIHDKQAKLQVRDTGIGIPKDAIPRIFERFYVVDKSRSRKSGGTGLGLSIVKHIVLLHNGAINVESAPGEGTSVTVLLPTDPSAL